MSCRTSLLDGISLPPRHAVRRDRRGRLRRPERSAPSPRARREGPARPGALRPRGGLGLPRLVASVSGKPKIARHEFLVFNQELATLLKAGMPLVQSLDILRTRLANPVFKAVLDDVHEKVRAGHGAVRRVSSRTASCFPSVYTASLMAGERAGNLDAVLRRFVAYAKVVDTVRKKTISALVYPVDPDRPGGRARRHHRDQGGADVLGLLQQLRRPAAAVDADHRRACPISCAATCC